MSDYIGSALVAVMGKNESITIIRPRQVNENGDFSEWSVWGDKHAVSAESLDDALWELLAEYWCE